MSLDSKLKEILQDYDHDPLQQEGIMDKIKQAFADEYVFMKRGDSSFTMYTGQEWYDRFIENMREHGLDTFTPEETHMSREQIAFSRAIKSAKKASGLT